MECESIVICPAYNEQDSVRKFYERLSKSYAGDVLFIDDGSSDATKDHLNDIHDERVSVIRHDRRKGYGAALIAGFNYSIEKGYKKIVTLDVDLQHNPEQINTFLRELEMYEVILGSRYVRIDRYLEIPRTRLLINRYIAGLIRVLFSTVFTDPFCGFRGYRDSFLGRAELEEESYGQGLEILMELIRMKIQFREIPIEALYPNPYRKFLDDLDDPGRRLLHYLSVIDRKRKEIKNEKEAPQASRQ